MAIVGRKPKPNALRILEGNREHRPINETIKPPPIQPRMPLCLFGPGATEWKRVCKLLKFIPLITQLDRAALTGYCSNWGIIIQCINYIKKNGGAAKYIEKCMKGNKPVRHLLELQKAQKEIRAFCVEFGFTPSSRSRIQIKAEVDNEDEDLD